MSTSVFVRSNTSEKARVVRMADALSVPDGGFSVDPRTGSDVTSGFAVAVYPDREQQITGRVTRGDVTAYLYRNADILARSGVVVGGWRCPDTGVAYLDVSRVVATEREAQTLATRHNQKAFFDFARGRSVTA